MSPRRMLSRCGPRTMAALTFAIAGVAAAEDGLLLQEGIAHARDDGRLVYREAHWRWSRDGRTQRLVLYRCPDGRPFARKQVAADASGQAPDFDFEDARDGYREGVRRGPRGPQVYFRQEAAAPLLERALAIPDGAVIDAGFDAGVRRHWDRLRRGQAVALPFLLPSRMAFVPVRLEPGPVQAWRGVPAQRMTMRLDRWYGFVAPRMQLTYSLADGRLLEFAGIATIRDADGRHQDVRITFPDPPAPAAEASLRQARAVKLVSDCAS